MIFVDFLRIVSSNSSSCQFFSPSDRFILFIFFQQDNLSFPLICPDWNADEEILLLEVHQFSGLRFWNQILGILWTIVIFLYINNNFKYNLQIMLFDFRVLKCMGLVTGPKLLSM